MSYLLSSDKQDCSAVLIDASVDPKQVSADLKKKRCRLAYILLTHYHADHIYNLSEMLKEFPEVKIGIHSYSLERLASQGYKNIFPIEDNVQTRFGDIEMTALYTPGHTVDSVCFWDENGENIFTGDTIFGGGIGCSDYGSGGNRNIFYQTILKLLKILPPQTKVYPGHYSEHYKTSPPYPLSTEKTLNPYLINTLHGRHGDFDRELKNFSRDFEIYDYAIMDESHIDEICALEKATWIPELQASKSTILKRLRLGHLILAIKRQDELLGMASWRYSNFSIEHPLKNFPHDFAEFSTHISASREEAQSAFIYNVGVKTTSREKGIGSLLLQEAFVRMRADGIAHVFVDSRLPSYNGSQKNDDEDVQQIPEFKSAIDRYYSRGKFPLESEFSLDPTVRFYMGNGFRPWAILKDFIKDKSSGNMRIICYMVLE
jgi:glyoxylase-like metal-dependent hydrolase (beta-lactamase superfamily II)